MADGSIVISAQLDDSQAQAELTRLNKKIYELQSQIEQMQNERAPWFQRAEELGAQLDEAKAKLESMRTTTVHPFSEEEIAEQAETVRSLQYQWDQANSKVDAYDRKIGTSVQKLEMAEARAGELAGQISGVGDAGQQMGSKIDLGLDRVVNKVEKLGKRIARLAKRVLFFSLITKALRGLRSWFSETIKGSDEASQAIGNLKGALQTMAYPIMQTVVPAINILLTALSKIVSAIAAVVAALAGMTLTEAVEGAQALNEEKDALEGVGGAAKDAQKSLAGFDEINKLTEKNGGGGGGGSSSSGISPLFDAIKNFSLPEWLQNFLTDFRLTVKDVVFDWSDVSGEGIAMKAIAGISALSGAVIGFSIGGVPGALTGALAGLVLGLIIDTVIFDNNGTLSKDELFRTLRTALLVLFGGVVGFTIGGILGSAIGITLGIVLSLFVSAVEISHEKAVRARAENTEIGALLAAALENDKATLQASADLRVRIDNITSEVSPEKLAELEQARTLVEQIFNLDAEDNKTAGQIAQINALIEELNSLGLEGVTLSFDEATQSVIGTKDAVLDTIDALLQQYQVEAAREAYIEAFRAQFEAYQNILVTTEELEQANRNYEDAVAGVAAAQERLAAAQDEVNSQYRAFDPDFDSYDDYYAAVNAANEELEVANELLEMASEHQNNLAQALQSSVDSYQDAAQKVDQLGAAFGDLVSSTAEATEAAVDGGRDIMAGTAQGIDEGLSVAENAISRAHRALQDTANLVDGINSPSTVYAQHGRFIMEGLAGGIDKFGYLAQDAMKRVLNSLAEITEMGLNSIISSFNVVAAGAGGAIGASIPSVNAVRIPRLAAGAVIPPNREFLAVLGDQTRGTNIEAPLETIVNAFRRVVGEGGASRTVIMEVDGREFGRVVLDAYNTENRRVGMRIGK